MEYIWSIFYVPPKTTSDLNFTAKIIKIVHGEPTMLIFEFIRIPYFYYDEFPNNIMAGDIVYVKYENTDKITAIKNIK